MIDPTTPQFAKFISTLAEQLKTARELNPLRYSWPLEALPQITARFAIALADNPRSVQKDSTAMRATCKALGIPRTYKAIEAYLKGEVQS